MNRAATRLQHLQVLVKKEREFKFGGGEKLLEEDLEKNLKQLIDKNVELTDANKKLSVIVKRMEKEKQGVEAKAKRAARAGGFRAATEETQKQIDLQEQLINKLKTQLTKTEKELQRVYVDREAERKIRERTGPFTANQDVDQLLFDLHSKDLKISELERRFQQISEAFKTKEALFDQSHQYYENSIKELHEANIKITKLETQLSAAQLAASQVKDMQMQLDEMAHEKVATEERLNTLLEQPFIKNAGTESETYKRLQEVERLNMEKDYTLRSMQERLIRADDEMGRLNDGLARTEMERDKARQELEDMRAQLHKSGLEMEDVQRLLNFHDPSHFRDVMSSLKMDGKDPNWFLQEAEDHAIDLNVIEDPVQLKHIIEKLRAQKMELATALEKAQTLLNVQTQMEKESGKLYEKEIAQLRMQLRGNHQKIEELAHLADARQNKLVKVEAGGAGAGPALEEQQSEFSHDDATTVLGEGENVLDLLVGTAQYDLLLIAECLKKNEGFELDLLGDHGGVLPIVESLLTVDFYNHEPYSSTILEGPQPQFNLQISFRNQVEPAYVKTLQEKSIRIELYFLKGTSTYKVAFGDLPLGELVKMAKEGRPRGKQYLPTLKRKIALFYHKSETQRPLKVGAIQCKLRLRHPMEEALRLFEEQHKMAEISQKNAAERERSAQAKPTLIDKKAYPQRGVAITLKQFNLAQPDGIQPFLFYKFFDQQDYFSATYHSGRCKLNETQRFYVLEDASLKSYFAHQNLEVVLFDEREPVQQIKPMVLSSVQGLATGVIGRAMVPLRDLIAKNSLLGTFDITPPKKPQERIGRLTIQIKVFDPSAPEYTAAGGMGVHPPHLRIAQEELMLRVALAIKARKLRYEDAFLIFDRNQDGLIDAEEFSETVIDQLSLDVDMLEEIVENGDLFLERVTRGRFVAALENIENRFPHRFSNALERQEDAEINRTLGLSANNAMYRELLDPLLKMMITNGIAHSYFRRVLLSYDKAGTGYVTKQAFASIFTSLGIPMGVGDLEQLASIMENKRTHKIEYLSMLQMLKVYEKDELQISKIEGSVSLQDSVLMQSFPNLDSIRQRARIAEIKIEDALYKKNLLLSKILQGRPIKDKQDMSILGIDAYLKDMLGVELRPPELQALFKLLVNLYAGEKENMKFEVFLKMLGRLNLGSVLRSVDRVLTAMKEPRYGQYLLRFTKDKKTMTDTQVQEMFRSLLDAKLSTYELEAFIEKFQKQGAVQLELVVKALLAQAPFALKTRTDDVVRSLSKQLKQSSLSTQKVFTWYARDNDGCLTFHQLLYALEQLHIPLAYDEAPALELHFKNTPEYAQRGNISTGEFMKLLQRKRAAESDQTRALKALKMIGRALNQNYAGDAKIFFSPFAQEGGLLKRRDFKNAVIRLHTAMPVQELDNLTNYLDAMRGEGMIPLSQLHQMLSTQGLGASMGQSDIDGGPSIDMQPRSVEDLSRSGII